MFLNSCCYYSVEFLFTTNELKYETTMTSYYCWYVEKYYMKVCWVLILVIEVENATTLQIPNSDK